jgi:hypothetical protein
MEEFNIEDYISLFLTSINEQWISIKRKEFEANPFYNGESEQLTIVDPYYDYEPVIEFDSKSRKNIKTETKYLPRTEVYDFKRYCLEYYNRGNYSNDDQSNYAWIGYCELEKLGESTLKPIFPNLKMLISVKLIDDLSHYFDSSIHSKAGMIKSIREFNLIFQQESKRIQKQDESKSKVISSLLVGLELVLNNLLIAKYGKNLEALDRPFHSDYTLDFEIDRTELAALIFLLMKSGLMKESKENLEFCLQHITFKKKNEQHLFTTHTNFTNVLGEIKQGKLGKKYHKLEAVMDLIQEAILEIKNT